MSVHRAAGLILTGLGTCTLVLIMCIVEVYRYFQGSDASYTRTLTSFPIPLYLAIPIAWTCIGIVLIVRGRDTGAK